jgi:hypothetical protein
MRHLLCLLLILITASMTFADETPPSIPDNECYEGGVMQGRCHVDFDGDGIISQDEMDWAWNCGWYLARFNAGVFGAEGVPTWCESLLSINSPVPEFECIIFGDDYTLCLLGNYLKEDLMHDGTFEQAWYIASGTILGDDGNCPTGTSYSSANIIDYQGDPFFDWLISKGFGPYDDFCRIS